MFLIRFLPRLFLLLQGYAIVMTTLRLAWPRPLWKLLRLVDVLFAQAIVGVLAAGIAICTRQLRPTLCADDSGRLPDVNEVWERYLKRQTFLPSESVTGLQGPFGNFVAHALYRRPARIERFDVQTDIGLRQRLSLRLLYAANMAQMREDGSLEPSIAHYQGDRFSTGFSACLKLLVDTHNAFVRDLRDGWDPFPGCGDRVAKGRDTTFAKAAALTWHTSVNFVEHEYFVGYTGFEAPFVLTYFQTAQVPALGFPRLRRHLSERLCVGVLTHLSYRPHWVLRNEISPDLPYAVGEVGGKSCHQAVADLKPDEIARLFRELARTHGGAAVPHNIPEFLERASIDALLNGRKLRVSYNDVLRSLRLPEATSFDRFRGGCILRELYDDVNDIEFPIGLLGDGLLTDRAGGAEASYVMGTLLVLSLMLDELFGWASASATAHEDDVCVHEEILRHREAKWQAFFACLPYRSAAEWIEWVYAGSPAPRHAARWRGRKEWERLRRGSDRFQENMRALSAALQRESRPARSRESLRCLRATSQ